MGFSECVREIVCRISWWFRKLRSGSPPRAHDARVDPVGFIASSQAQRKDFQAEADFLPGQRAEVDIGLRVDSIVLFDEDPVAVEGAGAYLVFEQVSDLAGLGLAAAYQTLEAIPRLNLDGRVLSLDIPIEGILRDEQHPAGVKSGTIFEARLFHLNRNEPAPLDHWAVHRLVAKL